MAVCPNCRSGDRSQRVTSIVSEGTTTSTSNYGSRITSTTDLARRLAQPNMPSSDAPKGCLTLLLEGLAGIALLAVLGGIALMAVGFPRGYAPEWAWGIVLFAIGTPFYVVFWRMRNSRWQPSKDRMASEWNAYRDELSRWGKAYYCYRDDILFWEDGTYRRV